MSSVDQNVKVFGLQANIWTPSRNDICIRFDLGKKGLEDTKELSVCYRAKASRLQATEVYISFSVSKDDVDALVITRTGSKLKVYIHNVQQSGLSALHTDLVLHRWEHHCYVFSHGHSRVFINGHERASGPLLVKDALLPLNSTLCLGMEQDSVGGGFDKTQIFRGYMAQVNIWNRKISDQDVMDIASCKMYGEGNVFSSDVDIVEEVGTTRDVVPLAKLCEPESDFFVIPMMFSIYEGRQECYRLGYGLYAPESPQKNKEMYNDSLQFLDTCTNTYHMWIGVSDEKEEGVWRRDSDKAVMRNLSWKLGQPDGMAKQNCVYMSVFDGLWSDEACDLNVLACISCTKRQNPPLRLRGMCFEMEAETAFEVLGYQNKRPYFHGFYGLIIFMTIPGLWVLYNTDTNTTLATLDLNSVNDFPIGHRTWILQNPVCDLPENSKLELSLSSCHDSEFTCDNGDCISKDLRCNSRDDCSDFSDEDNCHILSKPENYRSGRPPVSQNMGKPVRFSSKIQVLRFTNINDVKRIVSLELKLKVEWKDSRLKYLNLKDSMEWNTLTQREIDSIWRPVFEFPNVQDGQVRILKERLYVKKGGNPLPPEFNDVKMDLVYSGESNSLVQEQHYSGTFSCHFELFYYPFDKQKCSVHIQLSSIIQDAVFTHSDSVVEYLGFEELPLYIVNRFTSAATQRQEDQTRFSVLKMEFELHRRWTVIMMNLYLPTNLLLAAGYATLFLNVADQGERMDLTLTSLLVLYTLFNNTSSFIPVTAYVKMVDVWFVFCILLIFCIIVCHTLAKPDLDKVHNLTTSSPRRLKLLDQVPPEYFLKIMRRYLVPSFALGFSIIFWALLLGSLAS
nr:uncharacterized protein LOC123765176 [Procambarus clarkii]